MGGGNMTPVTSAMLKFAILGTLGELVARLLARKKISLMRTLYTAVVWAALGAVIKFMFLGFDGFVERLMDHSYLPAGKMWAAFFKSVFINILFGPWLVVCHRFLDSLVIRPFKMKTEGLKGALLTLLWFWIPAHTVTFSLPPDKRVTLAAVWSFVLGLILGIFANLKISARSYGEQKEP